MKKSPFLIFDAYGTLVELDDFYGHLQRNFARCGWEFSRDDIVRAAHREMAFYIERSMLARDRESWLDLRKQCAQVTCRSVARKTARFQLVVGKLCRSVERFDSFSRLSRSAVGFGKAQTARRRDGRGFQLGLRTAADFGKCRAETILFVCFEQRRSRQRQALAADFRARLAIGVCDSPAVATRRLHLYWRQSAQRCRTRSTHRLDAAVVGAQKTRFALW